MKWVILIGLLLVLAALLLVVRIGPNRLKVRPIDTTLLRDITPTKLLCVTCWYGADTTVYGAPDLLNVRKLFFTNNPSMIRKIVSAGWEPVVVNDKMFPRDVSPKDPDFHSFQQKKSPGAAGAVGASSLQSKQVKFLQFPQGYENLTKDYGTIVYMDHKRIVIDMRSMLSMHKSDILIRYDKKAKSIQNEVQLASFQPRYSRRMKRTVDWIEENYTASEPAPRIVNTGVIVYKTTANVLEFCREVFVTCMELEQPECQLVWAVVAQKYKESPKKVDINIVEYRSIETTPVFL